MKKFLYFSVAALALASCSSDDFLGTSPAEGLGSENTNEAIAFGGNTLRPTRAEVGGSEAAEKLHNNFVVYGFKTNAAEAADGSTDQKVFGRYNVNYTPGTANTTESNSANWEYVGYNSLEDQLQTIKYWDLSAKSYVFSAVSGTGITATKTDAGTTIYDKGWTVTIPAGGSLSDLYASDRVVVTKAGTEAGVSGKYMETVNLTFRALGTKIRFAMYETVPGYSVHIDKFYYGPVPATSKWANTETNFAINGTFKTANAEDETPLTITYYDAESGIENRPKVTYVPTDVTTGTYGIFGANIQATAALGTTSAEATYDQSDKSYTMILPFESTAGLDLYVDYTLTATDNSGEKIEVKHASAKVPTNFVQWKPNFAYTYLFKISDNTNGTTGEPGVNPEDPNDPTVDPVDPTGLFPITFDAVVISDEEDVQETITSVSDPSITTYQEGVVVTENNEYKAGDIYFENGTPDVSGYKVYEVNNFGTEATTEEVVANYLNNFCVLTEVETKDAFAENGGIPLTNGTVIAKTADQAHFFTAVAGKTYVITDGEGHYKVVKVTGSADAVTYTMTTASASITTIDGSAEITLTGNEVGVLGAVPCFAITSDNGNAALKVAPGTEDGKYDVTVDEAAIKAGKANDVYTVEFQGQSLVITVSIETALDITNVAVRAGDATAQNVTLTLGAGAEIINNNVGVNVVDNGDGTYGVTADKDAVAGIYTVTIAGVELKVYVNNYGFTPATLTIIKPMSGTGAGEVSLKNLRINALAAVNANKLTVSGTGLAIANKNASADGEYTLSASAGGEYEITFLNTAAKCVVTVNEYSIATPAAIKKATGIAPIQVMCNGKLINASKASLVETAKPTDAVYTLTTNGQSINFSSASKAGDYKFDYKVDDVIVAQVTVTVTD